MDDHGPLLEQLHIALNSPGARPTLLIGVVVAVVLCWPLARLFGRSPVLTLLALVSLAPIAAFTLLPDYAAEPVGATFRLHQYLDSYLHPLQFHADVDAPTAPAEPLANMLLFVPFGLFTTLATRAPVRTALAGVAVPFLIEAWQAVTGARVASAADWLHNSTGALIGVGAALVLLPLAGRSARPAWRRPADPPVTFRPGTVRPATHPAAAHRAATDRPAYDAITVDLAAR